MSFQFVEVEWVDAKFSGEWEAPDGLVEPGLCRTRGWLVKETDDYIVLASTVGEEGDEDVIGTCVLPRVMVKRIRRLKVSYGR